MAPDKVWAARLKLGFRPGSGKTVLAQRERSGPLAVQRPFYPEGHVCHVYLLHPPGGVAGGDLLAVEADLAPASHALITTPGATKFYRSAAPLAELQQQLRVANGGSLEWLPQENIFFPGAQVRMRTEVHLEGQARLAMWEIQCFGRPAVAETFDNGNLDLGLGVYRDSRPLLLDRLRVDPLRRLRRSLLQGLPVSATAVFSHAEKDHLERARTIIDNFEPGVAGATLIEDLLVVRYLGAATEQARKLFVAIWSELRQSLLQRAPLIPRIWNT